MLHFSSFPTTLFLILTTLLISSGDEGPTASEEGLFKITNLKSSNDLTNVLDSKPEDVASDSEGN